MLRPRSRHSRRSARLSTSDAHSSSLPTSVTGRKAVGLVGFWQDFGPAACDLAVGDSGRAIPLSLRYCAFGEPSEPSAYSHTHDLMRPISPIAEVAEAEEEVEPERCCR